MESSATQSHSRRRPVSELTARMAKFSLRPLLDQDRNAPMLVINRVEVKRPLLVESWATRGDINRRLWGRRPPLPIDWTARPTAMADAVTEIGHRGS
jgi:hypothetical protein